MSNTVWIRPVNSDVFDIWRTIAFPYGVFHIEKVGNSMYVLKLFFDTQVFILDSHEDAEFLKKRVDDVYLSVFSFAYDLGVSVERKYVNLKLQSLLKRK